MLRPIKCSLVKFCYSYANNLKKNEVERNTQPVHYVQTFLWHYLCSVLIAGIMSWFVSKRIKSEMQVKYWISFLFWI